MIHRPTLLLFAALLVFSTLALAGERPRGASRPSSAQPADVARSMDALRTELDTLRSRLSALEKADRARKKAAPAEPRGREKVQPRATGRALPGAAGLVGSEEFRRKVLEAVAPKLQPIETSLAGLAPNPARVKALEGHRHGHGHGVRNSKTVVANPDQMVFVPNAGKEVNFSSKPILSP